MPNRRIGDNAPPKQSGIYQITCVPTGKVYVGSTVNIRERWYRHRRLLRVGKHQNPHLQAAWDRYGEACFELSILELAERWDLLIVEQKWIDRIGCADPARGFNIYETAGSPGEKHAQIWEGFVDPAGKEVTIKNLFGFCRQHDLDFPSMLRLAQGRNRLKSYKGWTHRNSPRKREYTKTYTGFLDPCGQPIGAIQNLAQFVVSTTWKSRTWWR